MRNLRVLAPLLATLSVSVVMLAGEANVPKLDKQRLEAYIRYAEGYTAAVQFAIDDPVATPFSGYYRVRVHLTSGTNRLDRLYYVTADGQHFINGSIWDLNDSPFQDTLLRLPAAGYSFGPADAKVTIVVFSDFQCPYCNQLAKTLRDNVAQKYPKDVRVIFKDFPIEAIHNWARAAAEASHCLGDQKQEAFWAFHDWIFAHQSEVNGANVKDKALTIAKAQNLDDLTKAASCIDTHASASEVNESMQAGKALQVQQTPTEFINGRIIPGAIAWSNLDSVIQLELSRPKEIRGPVAQKCCEVSIPIASKK